MWHNMETTFLQLAELCNRLEQVPKTTEKIALISKFLLDLNKNEIEPAVFLIIGTTFAETDPATLDIKWKSLTKTRNTSKQTTLIQQPLTIRAVHSYFIELARASGPGSRKKKNRLLETLFRDASPVESKFIIRNIMGEMRHGVAEGVMIKAIAKAAHLDVNLVKRLSSIHGNLGEIAKISLTDGLEGLKKIKLTLFTPIKAMLADSIDSIDELFENEIPEIALEYKYDGVRVQIHKLKTEVRLYSRRLKEITSSFPEIVELIAKSIPNQSIILEGEIVAVKRDNNRPLPFQDLMRRFKRIHELDRLRYEIPVQLYLFDLLYLDDEILFDYPYQERWALLSKICQNNLTLATRIISSDKTAMTNFYRAALEAGHEGVLIKYLQSPYYPGERKKDWLKLKEAVLLDLVIVAADWGSGRRKGWLSNYHLAVLDAGTFHEIGKTFKGLTDAEFKKMTADLQQLKTYETDYTVYVKPQIVVEVAFNEIQKSPQYPSGYALRFARIKRLRFEKSSMEITTLDELATLYNRQFEKKAQI